MFSGYKSHTVVDDGVMGMCFSREMSTLRLIEKNAQILLAIPKKIGVKFVQTLGWPMHGGGVPMYPKN